jgi:chromosome segregation ATPase
MISNRVKKLFEEYEKLQTLQLDLEEMNLNIVKLSDGTHEFTGTSQNEFSNILHQFSHEIDDKNTKNAKMEILINDKKQRIKVYKGELHPPLETTAPAKAKPKPSPIYQKLPTYLIYLLFLVIVCKILYVVVDPFKFKKN